MSDWVIHCEGLGKRYRRGTRAPYHRLSETLTDMAKAPFGWFSKQTNTNAEDDGYFWALKEINLEVQRGEVIGIIGSNGAGKSTLLKLLSRITAPTEGEARVRGRLGSLLEVGTGFHPELTGRENVFLYGTILGMNRSEIQDKFDEIVSFAEVEKFLDMPVKRYSSGMYMRLAFAVAAHLDPEILIVDEVLAVGDVRYQKKCIDKLSEDAKTRQTTTLIVSHNLVTVKQLCSKVLLLEAGKAIDFGTATNVCLNFLKQRENTVGEGVKGRLRLCNSGDANILQCRLMQDGTPTRIVFPNTTLTLEIQVEVKTPGPIAIMGVLKDWQSVPAGYLQYGMLDESIFHLPVGVHELSLVLPQIALASGSYWIDIAVGAPNVKYYDYVIDAIEFTAEFLANSANGWMFEQSQRNGSFMLNFKLQSHTQGSGTANTASGAEQR